MSEIESRGDAATIEKSVLFGRLSLSEYLARFDADTLSTMNLALVLIRARQLELIVQELTMHRDYGEA